MSNGVYGTNIGAQITSDDIEIFYSYSPTRNSDDVNDADFTELPSSLLVQAKMTEEDKNVGGRYDNILEGLYNLKLPLKYFNKKGFYTLYIKPKEHFAVLQDVGVLSAYPDVKGLVIDTKVDGLHDSLRNLLQTNNSLVGYRVIYYDSKGNRENYYRIITSNNRIEPVVQNLSDVNQKAVRYRYNESSSLTFLTVTPSVATTFKPNATPYIGIATQRIGIVNTKFEPIMVEIEMVDHDFDTISTMLEGSQLRDLDNGLVTTFNENNEIYAQHEHYTLKEEFTSKPIFEVKKNKKESIDFTQNLNDKM